MGLFDKLLHSNHQSRNESGQASTARNTSSCPYCGAVLNPAPKKKRACPECSQDIYVRTTQKLFESNLLTKEQALAADFFKDLEYQGATVNDFKDAREALATKWGIDPQPYDVVWRVSNSLVTRAEYPGMVTFSQALYQLKRGNDPTPYLRAKYKSDTGADNSKYAILTNGCCTACSELENKPITAKEIAATQPLPNPQCSHKLAKGDKYSWCVCSYLPVTPLSHLTK